MDSAVFIRDQETPNSTRSIYKTFTINGSHTLEIHGFSTTKSMRVWKYISSDTFSVGGHSWEIQFYPNGKNVEKNGGDIYVSFNIVLVSKCEEDIEACFENVLLDQNGDKWRRQSDAKFTIGSLMSSPFTLNNSSTVCGYERFYKRTELEASQFINDDCLSIQCTVAVMKTSMYVPKTFVQPLPLSDLGQSYGQLLESGEGSDVSFEVEGEIFYAHKPQHFDEIKSDR